MRNLPSCEVLPEVREFERTSTTAVCAYVGPILESYLTQLETAVTGLGLPNLHIMGSTGGVFDVKEALRIPVNSIESGPAAGVIAAQLIGSQINEPDLISFDMGGTTAKGALIRSGSPLRKYDMEVARVHDFKRGSGLPVITPSIDMIEIGAGGGSIGSPNGVVGVGRSGLDREVEMVIG